MWGRASPCKFLWGGLEVPGVREPGPEGSHMWGRASALQVGVGSLRFPGLREPGQLHVGQGFSPASFCREGSVPGLREPGPERSCMWGRASALQASRLSRRAGAVAEVEHRWTKGCDGVIGETRAGYGEVQRALEGCTPEELDRRPGPGAWTARGIVHHLGDSEMTSAIRLRRLIAEDEAADPGIRPGRLLATAVL